MDATIRNSHGERIAYSFEPGAEGCQAIIVIGHGLTSDKERPWSQALSHGLARHGIASLRMAFSGNGASEGSFADSTITKEVEDLRSVVDALAGWCVGYVGHSMGAAVGLLAAVSDARIRLLVSLAGMVNTEEFATRMFGHLQPGEWMLGKSECPLSANFMADMRSVRSVTGKAKAVAVPWLLVHGDSDDVVPVTDSREVHAASTGKTEIAILKGADHSFSGGGIAAMTSVVLPWLRDQVAALGHGPPGPSPLGASPLRG